MKRCEKSSAYLLANPSPQEIRLYQWGVKRITGAR